MPAMHNYHAYPTKKDCYNYYHVPEVDWETGTEVCVKCGLVLDEQIYLPQQTPHPEQSREDSRHMKGSSNTSLRETLLEIAEKQHIPPSLTDSGLKLYRTMEERGFKKVVETNFLAALLLFIVCSWETPRSVTEWCDNLFIDKMAFKNLLRQAEEYTGQVRIKETHPAEMVDRMCPVNFSFKDRLRVKQLCKKLMQERELPGIRPQTVLACVIYFHGLDKSYNSMSTVCKNVGISTFKKMYKKILPLLEKADKM